MINETSSVPSVEVLKYAVLHSFVSPTFWPKLAEVKIELVRLSDAPKQIHAFYTNRGAVKCLLELDYTSFQDNFKPPKYYYEATGTLYNKNTIEAFKECDKKALLVTEGHKLLNDFESGRVLEEPECLARFAILSFADLKSFTFYYWFLFPCPLEPTLQTMCTTPQKLTDISEFNAFVSILGSTELKNLQFFIYNTTNTTRFLSLKECIRMQKTAENFMGEDLNNYYFCFADPSNDLKPSWLMRTFAAFLYYSCPVLIGCTLNFIGLRFNNKMRPDDSLVWRVKQNNLVNYNSETVHFVGWELNRHNKMAPNMVSMRASMDPLRLAETYIDLNLKLMKWRLLPQLDLEKISNAKCLLFGAGTLGCAVARNLLSWGFKHITLIDNGRVSYANPLRQNLYTHADAVSGNAMKATTAALRLLELNPNACTAGHVLQIPMPGHTIGESQKSQVSADLNTIEKLVKEHDVLFLLTDSRESRWLTTLLGAAFEKIVINAALGFDSYLVMRHGGSSKNVTPALQTDVNETVIENEDLKCIAGSQLGCYFCNDITAPGNSLKDRTLDQQCTVTRPGVSNIAASYAVELLVSLLQHPERELAPAFYCTNNTEANVQMPEGILGIIPHSIRGFLSNYENILPATTKFMQCMACSELVLSEYREQGHAFLLKCFETAKYLEDLTGITGYEELSNEIIDFEEYNSETE